MSEAEQESEPTGSEEGVDAAPSLSETAPSGSASQEEGGFRKVRQQEVPTRAGGVFGRITSSRLFKDVGSQRGHAALIWATRLLLGAVLVAFGLEWLRANEGMLFDPNLQNDDARTTLFPFHAYGSQGTLGDDPIAEEMLSAVPWGVRLLYMIFVPLVDLYWASKLVQAVALGILIWATVVLARARRTGLAAAGLLLFLVLHTTFATDRLAGGLPRAFGFPCFALWLAGLTAGKKGPRFAAPILLALSYPSIMNLILAAEGLLAVRGAFRMNWSVWGRRLRRYALLVAACFLCVLPAAVGSEERGPIHTLEQAEKEPAFGRRGRLWILPFADPVEAMSEAFLEPVSVRGATPLTEHKGFMRERELAAVLIVAFFLMLPALRLSTLPPVVPAFFAGTVVIYALSRAFAFQLYSPERYYSFGMRMACLTVLFGSVVHLWFFVDGKYRAVVRNLSAAALISGLWVFSGSGLQKNVGMVIDRKTDKPLYDFMRTLPKNVRFAAHVLDGDGIPYWGARAHTGSFETLQPWFTLSWERQKKRAIATLEALYATSPEEILRFADEYDVSHVLVNRSRYGKNMRKTAGSFEPFSSEVRRILRGKNSSDIYLSRPPKPAILFTHGRFSVLSIEKLRDVVKAP